MEPGWLMRGLRDSEERERGLEEAPPGVDSPSSLGDVSSSSPAAVEAAAVEGMGKALRAERVQLWKRNAELWLDEQPQGRLFTADDLVAAIGLPDVGQGRNNVVGAWINAQQQRRRIEFTGRIDKSRRVEGHGNLQRLWRVKDERAGGDAERMGPGVSSSPRRASLPQQKVEASTTSEASEGWDDQADPEQTCDGGHGQDVAPTGSADDVRAETALTANDGEGDPGSALNAGLADAPPGGPPEVGEPVQLSLEAA